MRKVLATFIVAILVLSTPILAEELGEVKSVDTEVKAILHLGKGLAISTSDPTDFSVVKAGVGKVGFRSGTESKELKAGVMFVDEERYRIRNATLEEGSLSAKLYLNATEVGSFSVLSTQKGEHEIWVGTLQLNGKSYNLYILELPREMKARELRDKVAGYCKDHAEDENCREKIQEYCENNPKDNKCLALTKAFCKDNTDDTRCRHELKTYCKDNPDAAECSKMPMIKAKMFCEQNPDAPRCKIAKKVMEKRGRQ